MAARGVTYAGGRIDAGYRGEIFVCLLNTNQPSYSVRVLRDAGGTILDVELVSTDASVHIHRGDKIVQMSPFEARTALPIEVVEDLSATERGGKGFGSTGR